MDRGPWTIQGTVYFPFYTIPQYYLIDWSRYIQGWRQVEWISTEIAFFVLRLIIYSPELLPSADVYIL